MFFTSSQTPESCVTALEAASRSLRAAACSSPAHACASLVAPMVRLIPFRAWAWAEMSP